MDVYEVTTYDKYSKWSHNNYFGKIKVNKKQKKKVSFIYCEHIYCKNKVKNIMDDAMHLILMFYINYYDGGIFV